MVTPDDITLVREYAASQSEPAFAAIVQRHIHHVYSAAIRQVGDPHLAEEITQVVFIILAQKARTLGPGTILTAWLHRTARFAANDAMRGKKRREAREQEAYMQSTLNEPDEIVWTEIEPLLDYALNQLGEVDRAALMLKFFGSKSVREIADALHLKENAAQKRIGRALEKLRAILERQGVAMPAARIAETVYANSVQSAPTRLIEITTTIALAKGATASTSALALAKGTSQVMTWVKVKAAIAKFTAVVAAVVATCFTVNAFRDISKQISPFTMVQFDGGDSNKVMVAYSGHTYQLAAVDGVPADDIPQFCRQEYGLPPVTEAWAEKRFAEDLVVVLADMNHPVSDHAVRLTLIDPQTRERIEVTHAPMTRENRQAIYRSRTLINSMIFSNIANSAKSQKH